MATAAQVSAFIAQIAPVIKKYATLYGYKVASPIIAQACCESAYGTSSLGYKYHNYFGMKCGSAWKGKSVNMGTKEEYTVGTLTNISANFRAYDSIEEGIEGYFKFISASRYENLKTATTAQQYLELIKKDGYATSSTYVNTNMTIVNKYCLTQYDGAELVAASLDTSIPTTGNYTLTSKMKVRTGAGTTFPQKKKNQLSANAQQFSDATGCLLAGTNVTVKKVVKNGSDYWALIPSGYVCMKSGSNIYMKKA